VRKRSGDGSRVGAIETQGLVHKLLNGLDQPDEILGLPVGGSPGVDVDPRRAGVGLAGGKFLDEFDVAVQYSFLDAFARAVDLLSDDLHVTILAWKYVRPIG